MTEKNGTVKSREHITDSLLWSEYAKARIDAGAECLDLEYDTIELIRILNTVPHGAFDGHDYSGLLEE